MAIAGSGRVVWDGSALNAILRGPNGEVARDLAQRAVKVDRTAKRLAPVDTGRLRASINWRIESDGRGLKAVVGTDVEYAVYQEFGTSKMAAHPFLRPALEAAK